MSRAFVVDQIDKRQLAVLEETLQEQGQQIDLYSAELQDLQQTQAEKSETRAVLEMEVIRYTEDISNANQDLLSLKGYVCGDIDSARGMKHKCWRLPAHFLRNP